MKRSHWLVGLLCMMLMVLAGCGAEGNTSGTNSKETITISAAASMQGAMEELKAMYLKERHLEANQIAIVYAGSGTLRQQIEQGAPSSLFISADQKNMKILVEKGLVSDVVPFTANALVTIVPAGKAPITLSTLGTANRIALGNVDTVPAGRYGKETLTALQLWEGVESKIVYAKDVKAVGAYIAEGAADVGFVYKTDAQALQGKVDITEIVPSNLHTPIEYPMGIVTKQSSGLTKDFYDFLRSPVARPILEKYGFTPMVAER